MVPDIRGILRNLTTLLKTWQPPDQETGLKFKAGQVLEAQVVAQKGDLFLLEHQGKRFYAKAETPLEPGQKMQLVVVENRGELHVLKKMTPGENEVWERENGTRLVMKRYGLSGENQMSQIENNLGKIPAEPAAAVRYLLDPHLVAALFLPNPQLAEDFYRLEINDCRKAPGGQDAVEVCLDLSTENLGRMEIIIRYLGGKIYTRIWAESPQTEELLAGEQAMLTEISPNIEIVPAAQGPILAYHSQKSLDVKA